MIYRLHVCNGGLICIALKSFSKAHPSFPARPKHGLQDFWVPRANAEFRQPSCEICKVAERYSVIHIIDGDCGYIHNHHGWRAIMLVSCLMNTLALTSCPALEACQKQISTCRATQRDTNKKTHTRLRGLGVATFASDFGHWLAGCTKGTWDFANM